MISWMLTFEPCLLPLVCNLLWMCVYLSCLVGLKERLSILVWSSVAIPSICGDHGRLWTFFPPSVDTEGSFVVERVTEIAMAAVQHLTSVANKSEDCGKYKI